MKSKFILWMERIKSSQTLTLGGLAILAGFATGVGVWIFKWLIEFVYGLAFGPVSGWTVALIPVPGGLLVGLVAHYFIGDEKVHGTAAIMQVFIPQETPCSMPGICLWLWQKVRRVRKSFAFAGARIQAHCEFQYHVRIHSAKQQKIFIKLQTNQFGVGFVLEICVIEDVRGRLTNPIGR